jgi:hypothetical protein
MTYTFKLARRLAVSRNYGMLPVLLVLAACDGGDATAPEVPSGTPTAGTEWRPRDLVPVAVKVRPSSVTLETNQLIQFRAHGTTSAGDSVGAAVTWSTSGGTILPDGRFSAAAIGTFAVIGYNRVRGTVQVDTSTVKVIRRNSRVKAVEISPTAISLASGVSQTFTALGRLPNGSAVPIGVNWSATGGSIDAGGTYVAGHAAGTYQVTATNTSGTLADTVPVTITSPPLPPPPPEPEPPTEPVLARVVLRPPTVTLAPGATKQFGVFGRTSTGDSIPVTAVFTATGGSITSGGLYTAGSSPGAYRVIATSSDLADTSFITISVPLGSGTLGIPFGPTQLISSGASPGDFTMSLDGTHASWIISRINWARSNRFRILMNMTGGHHDLYMSTIDGVYQFDRRKWEAKMNTYNTPEIKDAIAKGVADGTIIGNSVMDEPNAHGSPDVGGNTWGPSGTMTKARVDSLCGYVKAIFPTLPTGVFQRHDVLEPTKNYAQCEFIVDQYVSRVGDVVAFRDAALAFGQRSRISIIFSINILNGGTPDRDGTWDCAGTGGLGEQTNLCLMTPEQVRNFGLVLGQAGCGLLMWRYDSEFMANPDNQQAFKDIAARLASLPGRACTRI